MLLILALLATVFWVFSIVDCAVQPSTRHRGVPKGVWVAIVVLLPVLGGILWFVVGRGGKYVAAKWSAPDDDPEFLGRIGTESDQDERIRKLEEELALLDAEDDDPKWSTPDATSTPGATSTATDAPKPKPDPDGDDTRGQRGAVG